MNPALVTTPLWIAAGVALGSFAVTAGLRMAQGQSVLRGRSRCDHCAVELGFSRTIPLVSHLRLRGACEACGARIDPIHMGGEAAGGLVVASALLVADGPQAGLLAALGLVLVAACAADLKTKILPDILTITAGCLAIGLAWRNGGQGLSEGLIAGAGTFAALQGVRLWSMRRGRPAGLGFGDVKLASALAIWLGVLAPWMVLCASLMGMAAMSIARPADGRLPFGPALAAGAWLTGLVAEGGSWLTLL